MISHSCPALVRIVVVHPIPIVRLGIVKSLEKTYLPTEIAAFPSLSIIDALFGVDWPFSVALIDAHDWVAHGAAACLATARVGLISAAGSTPNIRLLRAKGLKGAISVTAGPEEFLAIVNAIIAGRDHFLSTRDATCLGLTRLTRREFEILELMTRGLLNKQIAGILGLVEATVKAHVSSIFVKLKCSRRHQAIATYMKLAGVCGS